MSPSVRRAMVDASGAAKVSVRRQCALLGLARSGVYRVPVATPADDLALMRRIDEVHLELPFYGSRRMTLELNARSRAAGSEELVNRKRVRRLMRTMGIEALVPRPGTSQAAPENKIHPYLLRGVMARGTRTSHIRLATIEMPPGIPSTTVFVGSSAMTPFPAAVHPLYRERVNDCPPARGSMEL